MGETVAVRPGEEIDADRLKAFLGKTLSDASIEIEQFPGGSSNLTYLVRMTSGSGSLGTHADEYVLRRPPFGNTVKSAHDMRREFDVLSKLSRVYAPAPKPLLFCDDELVIGSKFYLMERRHGLIIRGPLPRGQRVSSPHVSKGWRRKQASQGSQGSLAQEVSQNTRDADAMTAADLADSQIARKAVCRSFIRNLAELHRLDYAAAGLENLGRAEGYNRRQVEGWTKRYVAAKTDDWVAFEKTIEWLAGHVPPESGAALIHNDYKFDNVMLDPNDLTRITAVLDWEMVTVGDPLMDLGTTLGYWMSPEAPDEMLDMPFNPRVLMENITRRELVEMYAETLGRTIPDMLFYYVFGTFKIAVIAQQIYARYARGATRDPRFAGFNEFVGALGRIAADAIDRGRI
ncbi:MAG TPA: phosphotransferase family protein [Pyrinomonadaceae bacterium]|nr:phosphotransferase family protein [Pyrinomonadaceae bacterium]